MLWIIYQIFVLYNKCTLYLFVLLLVLLIKFIPNGEYSNLAFLNTIGFCLKSLPVKYSYYSGRSLDENAKILAASLPKSCWARFDLILSSRILIWSVTVIFINVLKDFSYILQDQLLIMLYQLPKRIWFFLTFSVNLHKVFIINICKIVNCNIL